MTYALALLPQGAKPCANIAAVTFEGGGVERDLEQGGLRKNDKW